MAIRPLIAIVPAVTALVFVSSLPAAADAVARPAEVGAYALTSGRLWAMIAALVGLAGVVIAGLVLRFAGAGRSARRGAVAALLSGVTGAGIGTWVVVAADGGPGTGYGIVGGFIAMAIGLVGTVLAGLCLVRFRRPVPRA